MAATAGITIQHDADRSSSIRRRYFQIFQPEYTTSFVFYHSDKCIVRLFGIYKLIYALDNSVVAIVVRLS